MQEVTLKGPRVIDGVVRQPAEGRIPVSDEEYDRLLSDDAIVTDEDGDGADDDGLEHMSLIELGLLVTKEGVPLNGKTKKPDLVAAIRAHRNPPA